MRVDRTPKSRLLRQLELRKDFLGICAAALLCALLTVVYQRGELRAGEPLPDAP